MVNAHIVVLKLFTNIIAGKYANKFDKYGEINKPEKA